MKRAKHFLFCKVALAAILIAPLGWAFAGAVGKQANAAVVRRMGGDFVEDNVPQSAYPMMRKYRNLIHQCFKRNDESLCQAGIKVSDQLIKEKHVCFGRYDDPMDRNGKRTPSWHICGKSSTWLDD